MKKITIFLIFLLIFFVNKSAFAVDYYVDQNHPQASDSNPGTEALPWLTINRGVCGSTDCINSPNASLAAKAGDTVLVKNGTYYQTRSDTARYRPVLNPQNSGSPGAPITFQAYPGDSVIITYAPGTTGRGPLIGVYQRNYVVWDGFIVQEVDENNAADTGPVVIFGEMNNYSDHDIIRNTEVRGVVATLSVPSSNHNSIRIENATNALIENNKLHGIQGIWVNQAAIMFYNTRNIIIQNNEIYDSYAGIFIKGPHDPINANNTVRYNLIHDTQVGIRMSFTYDTQVYQNIIRDGHSYNGDTLGLDYAETCGGTTSSTCATGYSTISNRDTYNNTIYNVYIGIYIPGKPDRITGSGNDWRNNIISATHYPISVGPVTPFGEVIENDFKSDYNNYYSFTAFRERQADQTFAGWKANTGYDANSITTDPLFVNTALSDFHLQAASPARNAGPDFGDLNNNGDVQERINLGAYVTGTETIGLASGSAPADTQAPTISFTAPTSGQAVSGASVTVSANASDNVGIAGVQFKLDGINLGAEDTTSPYSISWNTTTASNGVHTLAAVARDAAGNQTTSAAVSVSVSNALDLTAPTTPTNLTSTPFSPSQINLSWTASTDNVGVVGYRVERCQGAACTNFAQIAAPAGTTYSDTGLLANTTYRYQVRAVDATGNLSGYSTIASATTQAQTSDFVAVYLDGSTVNCSNGSTNYNPTSRSCGSGSDTVYSDLGLFSENIVPGATNYIRSGSYFLDNTKGSLYVSVAKSGSAANHTIIKAYPGEERQTIIGTSARGSTYNSSPGDISGAGSQGYYPNTVIAISGASYVTIDSVKTYGQVYTWGGHDVTLQNSDFGGGGPSEYQGNVVKLHTGYNLIVRNNLIHNSCWGENNENGSAIIFYDATALIENNTFYDNWGWDVFNKDSGGQSGRTTEIRYNFFGPSRIFPNVNGTRGHNQDVQSSAQLIHHNIFLNKKNGISVVSSPVVNDVYNNTFVNSSVDIISESSGRPQQLRTYNNIYYHPTSGKYFMQLYGTDYLMGSDWNIYFGTGIWGKSAPGALTWETTLSGWKKFIGMDTSSISSNPNFVNASGNTPVDFKRTSYVENFVGSPYSNRAGAYETGNEVIGSTYSELQIDTIVPTTPTNLIVTPISSSQINLSWSASTDDVGVTGYKIYRCTGSACTPTTQIATSATNSYSDTGLTASTVYTYVVSAYDAAGNESVQSATASATTQAQTSVQPQITGVTGTLTHGSTVTVTGSGFGTKTTAVPLKWDNFEIGVDGNDLTGYSLGNSGGVNPKYSSSTAHSGILSGYANFRSQYNCTAEYKSLNSLEEVYFSYWVKINKVSGANSRNIKLARLTAGYSGGSYLQPSIGFTQFDTSNSGLYYYGTGSKSVDIWANPLTKGSWHRVEYYSLLSNPGLADGKIAIWVDGVQIIANKGIMTRDNTSNTFQWMSLPYYVAHDDNSGTPVALEYDIFYDDVYIDSKQARVEVCDSSLWTKRSHCELQIPLSWSDTSITITANQGTFQNSQAAYLYVVDENGNVNESGYPVTIGGTPSDTQAPTAPTNLTATAISSSQINLSWNASTDDVGVTGYKIYRNGFLLPTSNIQLPTYSDTGLTASTTYTYTVSACDSAGNESAQSVTASATTLALPDTTLKGDVNSDNSVDILDIQAQVNHILGIQDYGASADVNKDGSVDVLDVQEVVNVILGIG